MKLLIHSQTLMMQSLKFGNGNKWFHPMLDYGCNYIFMLGFKLNHVSKGVPRWLVLHAHLSCITMTVIGNNSHNSGQWVASCQHMLTIYIPLCNAIANILQGCPTHWHLGDTAIISMPLWRKITSTLAVKLFISECQTISLIKSQHWSR